MTKFVKNFNSWMSSATNDMSEQQIYQVATSAVCSIGTRIQLADGKVYYYSSSDSDIAVAHLLESYDTDKSSFTVATAVAVGDDSISLTMAAVTYANEFSGSAIHDAAGNTYRISGNPADSTGAATITFTLSEPVRVAIAAAVTCTAMHNRYYNVDTSAQNAQVVGLCPIAITAGTDSDTYYFWAQTWGPAIVDCDFGSGCNDGDLAIQSATGGEAAPQTQTGSADTAIEMSIGTCMEPMDADGYFWIDLHIRP